MKLNYYLTFDGNCTEAFDFYKEIFGGSFSWKATYAQSPMKDDLPAEHQDKIMHVSLPIGNVDLMGCDRNPVMHKKDFTVGSNTQLSISPDSKEEADRLFAALSKGGSADIPMKDMFWGSYFGTLTDPYGIQWMLDCSTQSNKLSNAVTNLKKSVESVQRYVDNLEKIAKDETAKDEPPTKKHKAEES